MIRPLAKPPVSAGPAPSVRKDKDQAAPFHDWLAPQAPASAPGVAVANAFSAARVHAPVAHAAVSPAAASSTAIARGELAELLHPIASKASAPMLSATMQALMERSPASAPFAVQLRTHAGSVELIALPWRLVATGGLAHLFASRATASLPNRAIETRPAGTAAGAHPLAALPSAEEFDEACTTRDDGNARPAPAVAAAHGAMDSADDDRVAPASAHRQAALPWTARLLRWIEANGGAATLWFRDYRLEERGIPHLLATLRAAAGEAGLRLDRIVINGRTHWHLHRPTRETTHAG